YAAFDAAAERLAKQLRRYKRRLRDHHAKPREPVEAVESVREAVLAPIAEEAEEDPAGAPAVIAEISAELPRLTVGEAAMRMDLAEARVLLFRNRAHGEIQHIFHSSPQSERLVVAEA